MKPLVCVLILVLWPPITWNQNSQTGSHFHSLAKLASAVFVNGRWSESDKTTSDAIAPILNEALRESRRLKSLWYKPLQEAKSELHSPDAYDVLMRAMIIAYLNSTVPHQRKLWAKERWMLHLRMLKDPVTQRTFEAARKPEKDGSEYSRVLRIISDLQGSRSAIVREQLISEM